MPRQETTAERSRTMAAVKSKGTTPERHMARLLRREGVRFRQNARALPGTPDFVLPAARLAIFVHGCWWHGHTCKRGSRVPRTNRAYWINKVQRNQRRDARAARALRHMGYSVWTVWECRLTPDALPARLRRTIAERIVQRKQQW